MFGQATYAGMLLPWALLVIGIQWLAGHAVLRRHLRLLVIGSVLPTLYLVGADAVAIAQHIWTLHDNRILGPRLGNVPIEEVLFFLLTDTMVVQSLLLLDDHDLRRRVRRLLRRTPA